MLNIYGFMFTNRKKKCRNAFQTDAGRAGALCPGQNGTLPYPEQMHRRFFQICPHDGHNAQALSCTTPNLSKKALNCGHICILMQY